MRIWVAFADIASQMANKSVNSTLMRVPSCTVLLAMLMPTCGCFTCNQAYSQELQNGTVNSFNHIKQKVPSVAVAHKLVHARMRKKTGSALDPFTTIFATAGTEQLVDYSAYLIYNNDGTCTAYLGNYVITQQPTLGYLSTGTITISTVGWAPCPSSSYTVNAMWYTAYSAALIGNNHDDEFSYGFNGPSGSGEKYNDTLDVGIATISAPSSVWWFGGANPGSKTFPVSVPVNVNIGLATDTYAGPYNWHLITGSDVVKLSSPFGTDPVNEIYTDVVTVAAAPPNSPNDVKIELGMTAPDALGKPVDMKTPPIYLSVLEPYETIPDSRNPYCPSPQPTYGYDCQIIYSTKDQNGNKLHNASLPINENFTSNKTNVISNNWVPGVACGPTQQCNPVPNAGFWEDEMARAATPGYAASNVCSATTCVPQPSPSAKPLGTSLVQYWHGQWRFGSGNPGQDILFQTNDWDEFIDHGSHTNVLTGGGLAQ